MMDFNQAIETTTQELASAYKDVIKSHDEREYAYLAKSSMRLLENLGVPDNKIIDVANTVREMYRISDEADRNLEAGKSIAHAECFERIVNLASGLDEQLGINNGSIRDEIRWWYHYRLSRTKVLGTKPRKLAMLHFLSAFLFIFLEHMKRLRNPFALQCTLWLVLAGRKHEKRDWTAVQVLLKKYWFAKISGNRGRVEPKLVLL